MLAIMVGIMARCVGTLAWMLEHEDNPDIAPGGMPSC